MTLTPALSISGVHKSFGRFVALEGVDLEIWPGEFVSVTGHSGCGKSTLLNLVAGLNCPRRARSACSGGPSRGWGRNARWSCRTTACCPG